MYELITVNNIINVNKFEFVLIKKKKNCSLLENVREVSFQTKNYEIKRMKHVF